MTQPFCKRHAGDDGRQKGTDMIDSMEDAWRELASIRDRIQDYDEDSELVSRIQRVLNYLYMVEERL